MNASARSTFSSLEGYITPPYTCSYLPDREAQSLVAVLAPNQVHAAYDTLIQRGFRRSGGFVYAPKCKDCAQCKAMRLDVNQFKPTRSQKRAARALETMQIKLLPLQFDAAHFDLYQRYQDARHPGDSRAQTRDQSRHAFEQFLLSSQIDSQLLELRDANDALLAVSVVDWVADGASAVYTFYEPAAQGSLGTSAVMCLLDLAKMRGLPYVYLGYWIASSPKMAYKANFQPAQVFQNGAWQMFKA